LALELTLFVTKGEVVVKAEAEARANRAITSFMVEELDRSVENEDILECVLLVFL
jgi:hypothetical protein